VASYSRTILVNYCDKGFYRYYDNDSLFLGAPLFYLARWTIQMNSGYTSLTASVRLAVLEKRRRSPSALRMISYKAFLLPAVMMIIGGLIWGITALVSPTNLALILLGQVIFMIGMFVMIILGFWVMTIIRMPPR
jgi:hypothetical protein